MESPGNRCEHLNLTRISERSRIIIRIVIRLFFEIEKTAYHVEEHIVRKRFICVLLERLYGVRGILFKILRKGYPQRNSYHAPCERIGIVTVLLILAVIGHENECLEIDAILDKVINLLCEVVAKANRIVIASSLT